MSLRLGAPQPLAAAHLLDGFLCGEASLDGWLKRRALANQMSGATRTFVVADQDGRVYGYYAMAAGAVSHQMATSGVRRNMPEPIPVMVLARLAVDHRAPRRQARGGIAAGRRQPGSGRFAKRGCPSPARSRTARPRQAILRALRIPGITAASDDADASIEYREGLKDRFPPASAEDYTKETKACGTG
jgi:hypothetical protein